MQVQVEDLIDDVFPEFLLPIRVLVQNDLQIVGVNACDSSQTALGIEDDGLHHAGQLGDQEVHHAYLSTL